VSEYATMSDGTVLRERTGRSLGLTGDAAGTSNVGLLRLAAEHLDTAVLQPGKTTLDEADLCAIATLVRGVARLPS
jgi:hypothetical protein